MSCHVFYFLFCELEFRDNKKISSIGDPWRVSLFNFLPYILRRKTQGRCHEVTEGLSPTIENSYVVFPNPYPKKIRNEAVGKRFISKIQVYSYEFSAELKKATW